jgi:hypothetical protein
MGNANSGDHADHEGDAGADLMRAVHRIIRGVAALFSRRQDDADLGRASRLELASAAFARLDRARCASSALTSCGDGEFTGDDDETVAVVIASAGAWLPARRALGIAATLMLAGDE